MANRFSPSVRADPNARGKIIRGLFSGIDNFISGREFVRDRDRREAADDLNRQIIEADATSRGIDLPGSERIPGEEISAAFSTTPQDRDRRIPDVADLEEVASGPSTPTRGFGGPLPPTAGAPQQVDEAQGGPSAIRDIFSEQASSSSSDEPGDRPDVVLLPGQLGPSGDFTPTAIFNTPREAIDRVRTPSGAVVEDAESQRRRLIEEEFRTNRGAFERAGVRDDRLDLAAIDPKFGESELTREFKPRTAQEAVDFFTRTRGANEEREQAGLADRERIRQEAQTERTRLQERGKASRNRNGASVSEKRRSAENAYFNLIGQGSDPEDAFDQIERQFGSGVFTRADAARAQATVTRDDPKTEARAGAIRRQLEAGGEFSDTEEDQAMISMLAGGAKKQDVLDELRDALQLAGLSTGIIEDELDRMRFKLDILSDDEFGSLSPQPRQ